MGRTIFVAVSQEYIVQNIARTHGFESLDVEGEIPEAIRGTLFRTGPGIFERFGQKVHHPFEADGVVSAVRFGADGARGAARVVESKGYRTEEQAGRFMYNFSASLLDYLNAHITGEVKTTGNTATFMWQDRLFALMEAGKPQEIDPQTLDTLDDVDLGGVIKGAFSAHPHFVSSLNTYFNFGLRYGRKMEVDLYALPLDGAASHLGSFEAPWATMVHDFAATDEHLIFIIAPAKMVLWRALTRIGGMSKLFRWEPQRGCQLVRVPLAAPEQIERFELDAFWLWHTVNAYETSNETIVDLCTYPEMKMDFLSADTDDVPTAHLERLVLSKDRVQRQRLWDMPCEFPIVPDVLHGRDYDRGFFHLNRSGQFGLGAYRLSTGEERAWLCPTDHQPSEPIFVAGPDSPLEGWLLSLVADPQKNRSYLAILDTERIEDGPVARVWFDHQIPMTFHGCWMPEGDSPASETRTA